MEASQQILEDLYNLLLVFSILYGKLRTIISLPEFIFICLFGLLFLSNFYFVLFLFLFFALLCCYALFYCINTRLQLQYQHVAEDGEHNDHSDIDSDWGDQIEDNGPLDDVPLDQGGVNFNLPIFVQFDSTPPPVIDESQSGSIPRPVIDNRHILNRGQLWDYR